jgi:ABC-type sugar transport system permease subunit
MVARSRPASGTDSGRRRAKRRLGLRRPSSRTLSGVVLTAPAAILILAFLVYPALRNLEISLTRWDGIGVAVPIGVENYELAFAEPRVWRALINTVTFAVFTTLGTVTLGYLLAAAIHLGVRAGAGFRVIFFLPVMVPLTMTAIIWRALLDPTVGPVNTILESFGVTPLPGWLGDPGMALPVIILATIWQFAGFPMVIFLAAMSRIPRDVHDAASIDGVSTTQRLRYIMVPLNSRIIAVIGIVTLIAGFKVFDIVFAMTSGGPANSTEVIGLYLYQQVFTYFKVGYAAAVAVIMAALIVSATVVYLRLIRPERVEY